LGVSVGVWPREVTVGLAVGAGEGVDPFVRLRAGPFVRLRAGSFVGLRASVGSGGVEVGGTGVGVGSMVTARTTGSEGELLANTAWISNWVFRSM
jgi:hypothetical protein